MRDPHSKRRYGNLPPKKLYEILRGIYPKDIADELFTKLTGYKPPKEET